MSPAALARLRELCAEAQPLLRELAAAEGAYGARLDIGSWPHRAPILTLQGDSPRFLAGAGARTTLAAGGAAETSEADEDGLTVQRVSCRPVTDAEAARLAAAPSIRPPFLAAEGRAE